MLTPSFESLLDMCLHSLDWARALDYRGYSRGDTLNSNLLRAVAGESAGLRNLFSAIVKKAPINIRPLLGVTAQKNPKAVALFARACFNFYIATGERRLEHEALFLLDELLDGSMRDRHTGHCWGFDHPRRHVDGFVPACQPMASVTLTVADAFLAAHHLTENPAHLAVCRSIARFILEDLTCMQMGVGKRCYGSFPGDQTRLIHVNAGIASFMSRFGRIVENMEYELAARETMAWVVAQQTRDHAWYYADPPESSAITHGSHQTGHVLDCLGDYLAVFPNQDFSSARDHGLAYYRKTFFGPDFAPRFRPDQDTPHDIQDAAGGILSFLRAGEGDPANLEAASGILDWALTHMYHAGPGRFSYQKGRLFRKRFTLMCTCQAWMVYAMSLYLIGLVGKAEKR